MSSLQVAAIIGIDVVIAVILLILWKLEKRELRDGEVRDGD